MFAQIETLLKVVAASLGLIAALGLPAVYLHYSRYGVPTEFIGYNHVLKAGIVPFLLISSLFLYFSWSYNQMVDQTPTNVWAFLLVSFVFIMPILLIPAILYIVGTIAAALLLIWGYSWLLVALASWFFDFYISPKTLLIFDAILLTGVYLVWGLAYAFLRLMPDRWRVRLREWGAASPVVRGFIRRSSKSEDASDASAHIVEQKEEVYKEAAESATKPTQTIDDGDRKLLTWRNFFWFLAILSGFVSAFACVLLLMIIMEWQFYELSYWTMLFWGSTIVAIAVSISSLMVAAAALVSSDRRERRAAGYACFMIVAAFIIGGGSYLYSAYLYDSIPAAFGGGKSAVVDVWLDQTQFPASRVTGDKDVCGAQDETIICRAVNLLYADGETVILHSAEFEGARALILPRGAVKALSGTLVQK